MLVSCAVEWCQNTDTPLTASLHVLWSAAIWRIGEEKLDAHGEQRYPARRWVIERTRAWRSTCRGMLIRHETKAVHDLGLRLLARAFMWGRRWTPRIFLHASLQLNWSHATMGAWLGHGGLRRAVGMARAARGHAPHLATIPPTAVGRGVNGLGERLTSLLVPAKPRQHVVIRPRRGSGLRGAARPRAPADGEPWGARAPRLAKADLLLTLLAGSCYLQRIKLHTTAPACRSCTRMPERCLVMAVRIRAPLFTGDRHGVSTG
jgi:hypothetical protein